MKRYSVVVSDLSSQAISGGDENDQRHKGSVKNRDVGQSMLWT